MNDAVSVELVDELYALAHNEDLTHDESGIGCEHCDFLHVLKILKDRFQSLDDTAPQRQFKGKSMAEHMDEDTVERWSVHKERKEARAAKLDAIAKKRERRA